MTQDDIDVYFDTSTVKNFTDVLPTATDTDGSIFNGIGYKKGGYIAVNGSYVASDYYAGTGFIPCKSGDEIHIANMNFDNGDDNCRLVVYDADKKIIYDANNNVLLINRNNLLDGGNYYFGYRKTDNGCVITIKSVAALAKVAYVRFSVHHSCIGEYPMVSINEEIKYTVEGFLADDIFIKEKYVDGLEKKYVQESQNTTSISASSTDEQHPSAKAVYTLLQEALGEYVDDVAKIIGGSA
jgi:hypothetical protein